MPSPYFLPIFKLIVKRGDTKMRFTYLELENYIGVYNGMGLYRVCIDFSKASHRICVIKGTNGSGKTTIQSAISLFPDSNECFIPDKSAYKIVRVVNGFDKYEVKFYHDIKTGGVRSTTKAYIAKANQEGILEELNPNGNVTTYRDILYREFKLDPNFFALTKLSMDDRGLGYKRPADRKRFVNSIIESLETYNDIYKTMSKKTTALKTMMTTITAKLGSLGDKESLTSLKQSIETELYTLGEKRRDLDSQIAVARSKMQSIDPDSSIQMNYKKSIKELAAIEAALKKDITTYQSMNKLFVPELESKLLVDGLKKCYDDIAFFEKESEKLQAVSRSIIEQISTIRSQLELIISQMDSLKTDEYIRTEEELLKCREQAREVREAISVTGIDPNAFTKDEYILALETVHEIVSMVDMFRSTYDYSMINTCIADFSAIGYTGMPPIIDCSGDERLVSSSSNIISDFVINISDARSRLELANMLANRPKECTIDGCFYIADAVKAASTNPQETIDRLSKELEDFKEDVKEASERIQYAQTYNSCINAIRTIIRSIDKNNSILTRLPNGGIFESKAQFFEALANGQSFEFIDRLYQYITLSNYIDQYRVLKTTIERYEDRLKSMSANRESFNKFEESKQKLLTTIRDLEMRLSANSQALKRLEEVIAKAKAYASYINDQLIPKCDRIISNLQKRDEIRQSLNDMNSAMKDIDTHEQQITELYSQLRVVEFQIKSKEIDRDSVNYKLMQIADNEKVLAEYKSKYELYEKIKYYSSPTTGIQLVFMQLYMGNILTISNQLLSYLFGGQYQLQPFIINEDEFRIPCIGNGYLNDDISSMSSSQLTMISMILSFALLSVSSTEYNVIKLDEIDDPLDEPNRMAFAQMLDSIMDIMHTEQCIMISHSSEMITSNADIILLRSDGLASIDTDANIIWDYSRE